MMKEIELLRLALLAFRDLEAGFPAHEIGSPEGKGVHGLVGAIANRLAELGALPSDDRSALTETFPELNLPVQRPHQWETDGLRAVFQGLTEGGWTFADCLNFHGSEADDPFVRAAREIHAHGSDGDIDIDDYPVLSVSDDGAYVLGWLWVGNEAAGVHHAQESEPSADVPEVVAATVVAAEVAPAEVVAEPSSATPEATPSQAARELLAQAYEESIGTGPFPSYADLARFGQGGFTMCALRAVERALQAGSLKKLAAGMPTEGEINDLTHRELGQWPSFEAQAWAAKVATLALKFYRVGTNLGGTAEEQSLPTDEQIVAYAQAVEDTEGGTVARRSNFIKAVRSILVDFGPQPAGEPLAWRYEIATVLLDGRIYDGWEERISKFKPNVPEGSVRKLTPLHELAKREKVA